MFVKQFLRTDSLHPSVQERGVANDNEEIKRDPLQVYFINLPSSRWWSECDVLFVSCSYTIQHQLIPEITTVSLILVYVFVFCIYTCMSLYHVQ